MRTLILQSNNNSITLTANGLKTSFTALEPIDILIASIAKDIYEKIKNKSKASEITINSFSVKVVIRKNTEKDKSKIIETHLELPKAFPTEIKNKFKKIADKSHLKRLLSNEILFEPTNNKE